MGAPIQRPMPADFADYAQKPLRQIEHRYRVGRTTVHRWIREAAIERTPHAGGNPPRPVPDDFPEFSADKSTYQLAEHYGCSRETVNSWFRRCGIERPFRGRGPTAGRPKKAKSFVTPKRGTLVRHYSDQSLPARAADYLRRLGPVTRCNADGSFNPHGNHWCRGRTILTAAEIIDRARRNGWADPLARFDAPPSHDFNTEGANA